jgi:hypothetical protein
MKAQTRIALLSLLPAISLAQVPVDDSGNVIGNYESQADTVSVGEDGIPRLSQTQLQELVGPVALYPDDLLAIVLPAAAYPLQIVEAARFLKALESDPTLKPNDDWDDSIVALLNYPEVIDLLNEDLDWTLRLGEAVVVQQTDVVTAVEAFRDRAYDAGNLKSDEYQVVSRDDDDVIYISPAEEDVIYVPYYEPEQVVYYQPRPVYHYYPRSYPVYYYPYAAGHYFNHGFFWGVTTAFTIGWITDSLHVYHHSYYGHPYYGHSYWNNYWYRSPSIHTYNTHYGNYGHGNSNHYSHGDRWYPSESRRAYTRREGYTRYDYQTVQRAANKESRYEPISFRERDDRPSQRSANNRSSANSRSSANNRNREPITFRERSDRSSQRDRNIRSQQARVAQNRNSDVAVRTRDTRRQEPATQARNTRRDEAVAQVRNTRRQQPETQARNTRRQEPVTQARNTRRQEAPTRSRETYQRAPTRTERAPARTERAPTRTQSAPARTQGSQPSQSQSSRGQESKSSNSGRSESRSSGSRSRDRH